MHRTGLAQTKRLSVSATPGTVRTWQKTCSSKLNKKDRRKGKCFLFAQPIFLFLMFFSFLLTPHTHLQYSNKTSQSLTLSRTKWAEGFLSLIHMNHSQEVKFQTPNLKLKRVFWVIFTPACLDPDFKILENSDFKILENTRKSIPLQENHEVLHFNQFNRSAIVSWAPVTCQVLGNQGSGVSVIATCRC